MTVLAVMKGYKKHLNRGCPKKKISAPKHHSTLTAPMISHRKKAHFQATLRKIFFSSSLKSKS